MFAPDEQGLRASTRTARAPSSCRPREVGSIYVSAARNLPGIATVLAIWQSGQFPGAGSSTVRRPPVTGTGERTPKSFGGPNRSLAGIEDFCSDSRGGIVRGAILPVDRGSSVPGRGWAGHFQGALFRGCCLPACLRNPVAIIVAMACEWAISPRWAGPRLQRPFPPPARGLLRPNATLPATRATRTPLLQLWFRVAGSWLRLRPGGLREVIATMVTFRMAAATRRRGPESHSALSRPRIRFRHRSASISSVPGGRPSTAPKWPPRFPEGLVRLIFVVPSRPI